MRSRNAINRDVRFLSPANQELDQTIRYYDRLQAGLSSRFFQEVDSAVDRIQFFPQGWTRIGTKTRRCLIKGFPYALLYHLAQDDIIVSAVAILHRDPRDYDDRIE